MRRANFCNKGIVKPGNARNALNCNKGMKSIGKKSGPVAKLSLSAKSFGRKSAGGTMVASARRHLSSATTTNSTNSRMLSNSSSSSPSRLSTKHLKVEPSDRFATTGFKRHKNTP